MNCRDPTVERGVKGCVVEILAREPELLFGGFDRRGAGFHASRRLVKGALRVIHCLLGAGSLVKHPTLPVEILTSQGQTRTRSDEVLTRLAQLCLPRLHQRAETCLFEVGDRLALTYELAFLVERRAADLYSHVQYGEYSASDFESDPFLAVETDHSGESASDGQLPLLEFHHGHGPRRHRSLGFWVVSTTGGEQEKSRT